MLVIATKSPFTKALPPASDKLSLVLTQDAVIAATAATTKSALNEYRAVYALESDITARGLSDHISSYIQVIELSDFVKLTANHQPLVNW
ncbi:sulfurtransferase complex subunit TusB [Psychrobium sp. MM17-31]|uniref:sulfurtransferase complex subunit TusB n=1 Tax=Psychrobium sp. MM17-31 TaxID=2917758 RepID=UPI001EF54A99|nr:sulfurtransferase complex subunit TusB [Psychrobium sp. MM17-31]MCG7531782.1 sulfurtransferase complex subunit TusB [Psychrobium sp. MM17-31]